VIDLVDLASEYINALYIWVDSIKSDGCGGAFFACKYVLENVLMTAAWLNGA